MGGKTDDPAGSEAFLASTDVIDWYHSEVRIFAWLLAAGVRDPVEIAQRCFEWVRDEVRHSVDEFESRVTCAASDVLLHRTGLCYAKSHLLAALLRANGIPAGFCYQRLSRDGIGPPYCLHGLNAVYLPEHGWYRADPRGNTRRVHTSFSPPCERIAYPVHLPGEETLPEIWPEPLPIVVETLRGHATVAAVSANLPDYAAAAGK